MIRFYWALMLCACFFFSGQAYAQTTFSQVKVFKDWAVACNNLGYCEAVSLILPDWGADAHKEYSAVIRFSRGAGVNDYPMFGIQLGFFGTLPTGAIGQNIVVSAGGRSLNLGTHKVQDGESFQVPAAKVSEFLAMIRQPAELSVQLGQERYTASLRGIMAAMLYTDEQQQRLDTPTALVRQGSRPMGATRPPVQAVRAVKAPAGSKVPVGLPERIRREQGTIIQGCAGGGNPAMDFAEALDTQHYLVGISCWLAAYNSGSLLFKVRADSLSAPQLNAELLEVFKYAEDLQGKDISGAYYERKTGILSSYHKGRGIGDCGTYMEWAWNGQQFVLTSYEEMPACRGVPEYLSLWSLPVQ